MLWQLFATSDSCRFDVVTGSAAFWLQILQGWPGVLHHCAMVSAGHVRPTDHWTFTMAALTYNLELAVWRSMRSCRHHHDISTHLEGVFISVLFSALSKLELLCNCAQYKLILTLAFTI